MNTAHQPRRRAVRRRSTPALPRPRPRGAGELLGGLEADTADLVAERGPGALGDPDAYAAELRAAAGLPPYAPRRSRAWPAVGLGELLDDVHRVWDRTLDAMPGSPRGLVECVQPVWWVVRAVVAWLLVQDFRYPSVVLDARWWLVLAVMVVISVQLGRGAGRLGILRRAAAGRLVVVALNLLALALLPGAVDRVACTLRVVDKEGRRVEGLRVVDATCRELLPMNRPGC